MTDLIRIFFNEYDGTWVFACVFLMWISFFALLSITNIVLGLVAQYIEVDTEKWRTRVSTFKDRVDILGFLALVGCGALISVDAYVDYFGNRPMSSDPEQWGQMGDFFGGMLNPILAFASFIALLYTITLQSKAMEESRKESQEAREEARLSRTEQAKAVVIAQANLKLQERLEVFKGLDSILRDRSAEAQNLYIQIDANGSSLQLVLSEKLNELSHKSQMELKEQNKNRGDGVPAIDWQNAKVNVLHLKKLICHETVHSDGSLHRIAARYHAAAHYELQVYKQLKAVVKVLELTDGLVDMYAQVLVHNLLFSSLCFWNSVVIGPSWLADTCPRLSEHMKTLYSNLGLELPQNTETDNQKPA